MKPKGVTLIFKRYVREAGFIELTAPDFLFVGSPSCDVPLTFHVRDETEKRHPRLQAFCGGLFFHRRSFV
jgi:hypothetical protein